MKSKFGKKLIIKNIIIITILFGFFGVSYAIIKSLVSVENNEIATGTVKINLNDGKPILNEDEYLFEPGMNITKEFFVENQSTDDVYYKLYFDNVTGDLKDIIFVTIKNKDKVYYEGALEQLTEENVDAAGDILKYQETHNLEISFYYPQQKSNDSQNKTVDFVLKAKSVQVKNNQEKEF